MVKKTALFKTKGMNRDLSVSAFKEDFSFENMNLRLSTNEHNTLLSWVNERGPLEVALWEKGGSSSSDGSSGGSSSGGSTDSTDSSNSSNGVEESEYSAISSLVGVAVGLAVIDHKLVVFTAESGVEGAADHIYVLYYDYSSNGVRSDGVSSSSSDGSDGGSSSSESSEGESSSGVSSSSDGVRMIVEELFAGNLGFSTEWPLETLTYYESSLVEKVYWTDGINQPRIINIAGDKEKWKNSSSGVSSSGVSTCFDFVPAVGLKEQMTVVKNVSDAGLFAPGVIQYCFTYINKYGQQSNIVSTSALYYLTHNDRGASGEESVSCSFTITIKDVDQSFDYVRLYSIQRTSLDGEVVAKQLEDLEIAGGTADSDGNVTLSYVDNGTNGASVDATELFYVGGKEISAYTMAMKDNTLFLGNITEKNILMNDLQDYFDSIRGSENLETVQFSNDTQEAGKAYTEKVMQMDDASGKVYSNTFTLNSSQRQITTFKGGETYRMGIQFQKDTGEWLEPVWIDDVKNEYYPKTYLGKNEADLVYGHYHLYWKKLVEETLKDSSTDYSRLKRVRPVVVYPSIGDRSVLCQGVLNPTVFNIEDRVSSSPYSQASWFFRPYMWNLTDSRSKATTVTITDDAITADTKTGTSSKSGTGEKPNCDPDAYFNGKTIGCYVLVARVQISQLKDILSNKRLIRSRTYKDSSGNLRTQDVPASFYGAIELEREDNDTTQLPLYAFVRLDDYWVGNNAKANGEEAEMTYQNIEDVAVTDVPFQIYTGMYTQNGLLYYLQPKDSTEEEAGTYTFRFYTNYTTTEVDDSYNYYEVKFTSMGEDDGSNIVDTTSLDAGSSDLQFMHYGSLYTADKCDNDYKRMEIQGGYNEYTTPFDAKIDCASNTQFFVDQSIVTLNSPDLEFDTTVQKYSTEGLKLRIVGAIPLTANASSHYITNSTAMLEKAHNVPAPSSIMKTLGLTQWYSEVTGWVKNKSFGKGESSDNVIYKNLSQNAGKRLVANYLWNDVIVVEAPDEEDKVKTAAKTIDYLVYPWQRTGSLNNDRRAESEASSVLEEKIEATLSYSFATKYIDTDWRDDYLAVKSDGDAAFDFDNLSIAATLTENSEVMNYNLSKQSDAASNINYYANIDKVLVNSHGYRTYVNTKSQDVDKAVNEKSVTKVDEDEKNYLITSPVWMRYKSTSHYAIALKAADGSTEIPILPYGEMDINSSNKTSGRYEGGSGPTFWGDTMKFKQHELKMDEFFGDRDSDGNVGTATPFSWLWLGELYKDVSNRFGGTSRNAIRANAWLPAGDAVNLQDSDGNEMDDVALFWTNGDTYYQRYDCLKTYPFASGDKNQLVEILSFMVESRVNLDGRWDKNRGQMNNTYINANNFNRMNDVYSQRDNFFNYSRLGVEEGSSDSSSNGVRSSGVSSSGEWSNEILSYRNQAYYSKTKISGADVDLWTNVTLGSVLEFDGDKGALNAIRRLGNDLVAFQDTGISQILYNENVQVSTQNGVPIEIANSGKVQGVRYYADTVGCQNKWAMATTPQGIYFMDNINRNIYLFNGKLTDLSTSMGMSTWTKQNMEWKNKIWNPVDFSNFVAYWDKQNQEVLFVNKETALAYSEKIGAFTSFYDYGGTPWFANLDSTGVWLHPDGSNTKVWQHQAGEYCNFFGQQKPYWMTLVGNPEPTVDKIFTNLEFLASVDGEGGNDSNGRYNPLLPFDYLEAWNEYQHGITKLGTLWGHVNMTHHSESSNGVSSNGVSSLKRKFRLWRCDVPRDNAEVPDSLGLPREKRRFLDRMRNPWVYLKLMKENDTDARVEVHDVGMGYFS